MERTGGSVIRPPESAGWQSAERFFLDTARLAGYEEVRFPAGEKPDFKGLYPAKYSYVLPSKGMGAAAVGVGSPAAAAELAAMAGNFLGFLGLQAVSLVISGPADQMERMGAALTALQLDFAHEEGEAFALRLTVGERQVGKGGSLEPAGFWMELDTGMVLKAVNEQGASLPKADPLMLFLCPAGPEGELAALSAAEELRSEGFSAEVDWSGCTPEEGLAKARQKGARFFSALDGTEDGKISILSLEDGTCTPVPLGDGLTRFFYDSELSELSGALDGIPFSLDI